MTEAGHAAFARAEEIFQLGQLVPEEVREAASGKVARLTVGLYAGISKMAAHALLAPVLATPTLRLLCHEGEFGQLLAELPMHRLDPVLAGQSAPHNPNLRLTHERCAAGDKAPGPDRARRRTAGAYRIGICIHGRQI